MTRKNDLITFEFFSFFWQWYQKLLALEKKFEKY